MWESPQSCGGAHQWGAGLSERRRGSAHGPNAQVGNTLAAVDPTIQQQGQFCQNDAHEWTSAGSRRVQPTASQNSTLTGGIPPGGELRGNGQSPGETCIRCGAWRGEWGTEPTPQLYVEHSVSVFAEVWRVMRKDATLWVNLGDCYATGANGRSAADTKAAGKDDRTFRDKPFSTVGGVLKPKDLAMIPARFAIAMQEAGWWIRSDIAWCKRSPMPESITDRPTSAWEHIFLFTKAERYFYDATAVREPTSSNSNFGGERPEKPMLSSLARANENHHRHRLGNGSVGQASGRNLWNYWTLSSEPFPDAHFATFPTEIPERAIKAGTSEAGACAECGAPWRRVTEKGALVKTNSDCGNVRPHETGKDFDDVETQSAHRTRDGHVPGHSYERTTTGWEPTCKHTHGERVPCEVLDICGGSGTTGMVADRLGRNATLIELKPEYAQMARARITNDSPMFAEVVPEGQTPTSSRLPLPLFGEGAA